MASAMIVVGAFLFLVAVHPTFSNPIIDLAAEYEAINAELEGMDPSKQVETLKHKLVAERQDHRRTKDERVEADLKADAAIRNATRFEEQKILSFPIHKAESNFSTFDKEFDEECYKVRLEMEGTSKNRREEALIKKVALARVEKKKEIREKEKEIREKDKEIGKIKNEKELLQNQSASIAVLPVLRLKLEWYEKLWSTGGNTCVEFEEILLQPVPWRLDEQTESNMRDHARTWDKIMNNSPFEAAKNFTRRLKKLFPGVSTALISKYVGLLYARFKNAQHGPVGQEALKLLRNIDTLIAALSNWDAIDDPIMLEIVRAFQEVTTGQHSMTKKS